MSISSHEFTPTLGDPGLCGVGTCGAPWFHPVHNPANQPKWGGTPRTFSGTSAYTEILNEAMIRAEDVNATPAEPKCPVGDCLQTLPHLHPRQEAGPGEPDTVPDAIDELKRQACAFTDKLSRTINPSIQRTSQVLPEWVDNIHVLTPPHRFVIKSTTSMMGKDMENADYCDHCDCLPDNTERHPNFRPLRCAYHKPCSNLSFDRPSQLAEHSLRVHGLDNWQVMEYLQDPWLVGESRADWKDRTFAERYGTKGADKIVTIEMNPDPTALANALKQAGETFRQAFGPTPEEQVEVPADPISFRDWWVEWVDNAAPTIQRKAAEYGSNSLAEMGRTFARAQGRGHIEDHEALEIGCMFYAKGKIERVLDAMLQGTLPSADTWGDTMIYAAMASYIREFRRWP